MEDRVSLHEKSWDRSKPLLIFDELHKLKNWKSWLKGIYDTGQVMGDSGAKLENAVACAIKKEIHFREDCFGEERKLFYIRNKEGKEIDFCVVSNNNPSLLLEVKWKDKKLSTNFEKFKKFFPGVKMVQVSKALNREKTFPNGAELRDASKWLSELSLPFHKAKSPFFSNFRRFIIHKKLQERCSDISEKGFTGMSFD